MAIVSRLPGSVTALTITLASLAASATAGRESTVVNNITDAAVDAEIWGQIMTGTTPTNNSVIAIWVYFGGDTGEYCGGAAGADAALTPTGIVRMKLLDSITVSSTSNVAHKFALPSLVALLGGMPSYYGFWVNNNSGVALHATGSNHFIKRRTLTFQSS